VNASGTVPADSSNASERVQVSCLMRTRLLTRCSRSTSLMPFHTNSPPIRQKCKRIPDVYIAFDEITVSRFTNLTQYV